MVNFYQTFLEFVPSSRENKRGTFYILRSRDLLPFLTQIGVLDEFIRFVELDHNPLILDLTSKIIKVENFQVIPPQYNILKMYDTSKVLVYRTIKG